MRRLRIGYYILSIVLFAVWMVFELLNMPRVASRLPFVARALLNVFWSLLSFIFVIYFVVSATIIFKRGYDWKDRFFPVWVVLVMPFFWLGQGLQGFFDIIAWVFSLLAILYSICILLRFEILREIFPFKLSQPWKAVLIFFLIGLYVTVIGTASIIYHDISETAVSFTPTSADMIPNLVTLTPMIPGLAFDQFVGFCVQTGCYGQRGLCISSCDLWSIIITNLSFYSIMGIIAGLCFSEERKK